MNNRLDKFIGSIMLTFLTLCVLGIVAGLALVFWPQQQTKASDSANIRPIPFGPHVIQPADIDLTALNNLVNQNRQNAGISPLLTDARLDKSAQLKCGDITSQNYWAHVSPNGIGPVDFITSQGVPNTHLGENLAEGFDSAGAVDKAWMNSPEHKDNLLDQSFTEVGYAVCKSDSFVQNNQRPALIVVQHFAQL